MAAPKVFIFAPADPTEETHRRLEMAGCQLVLGKAGWHTPQGNNEDEMATMARDAVALVGTSIRSSPITRRIMASSDQLRIVAKYTIGVDDVDVDAATELGILVTHGPTESNWGGVAEGTMAMILALLKRVRERDEHMKRGGWRLDELQGTYLGARQDGYPGITIGIVGLGRIGARLAMLLQPWRVRLLGCDPYVTRDRFALLGVQAVDLDTLLRESDVVTLHVTLTRETYHLIGAAELAKMKPTAVLINTSRGKVVDEAALADALNRDVIRAAALDVFEDEPLAQDSPLLRLGHKVLLSPHMVSSNLDSGLGPGIEWATESVLRALRGELPDNVYNKEVIPRWLERFGGRSVLPAP
ncbi:MAG: D-glycerate dehydrogenase [Chloroflexi bacterium]|nr:D-glycerate dehydrogenase [Chloroflexota bacterium]